MVFEGEFAVKLQANVDEVGWMVRTRPSHYGDGRIFFSSPGSAKTKHFFKIVPSSAHAPEIAPLLNSSQIPVKVVQLTTCYRLSLLQYIINCFYSYYLIICSKLFYENTGKTFACLKAGTHCSFHCCRYIQ